MSNLLKALRFTLKWEGGFSDDKVDPGGLTKYGISDKGDGTLDRLIDLERDGKGDIPVKELTREQAYKIYETFYWIPAGCEALPLAESVAVFDTAVNCGVARAKRWLREAKDLKEFLEKRRMHYYQLADDNPKFHKYINGWTNRLNDLRKYLDILAAEEHLPKGTYIPQLKG